MSEIDQDAVARTQIRQLRGMLLRVLKAAIASGGMKPALITRTLEGLAEEASERRVGEALSYLEAAGLVERTEVRIDKLDKAPQVIWKITAKGVQVTEGVAEDPAVDMG